MSDGSAVTFRVGVDENGLGARLGPLVVTAVLARVSESGESLWVRRPRGRLAEDLDDSKRLVSHGNVALGEAWARVLTGDRHADPEALFSALSIEASASLRADCPTHLERQCWGAVGERFESSPALRSRLSGHLTRLGRRGVEVLDVRVASTCTKRLNRDREAGGNRFVSDLHSMERLLLALSRAAPGDIVATCGKVGSMSDYDRFFGPLSGRLHSCLERGPRRSEYHFPGLGRVSFVRDADSRDPLVMLASLVGKYVRELLMRRVTRFYEAAGQRSETVSGYHDARTRAWVRQTARRRRSLRVHDGCFERAGDAG